jgi:hypothetical protein
MHFKSPHSRLALSAIHFYLPKVYRRPYIERDLEVLVANVSHNVRRFPHLHRLTQICYNLPIYAMFIEVIRNSIQ